MVITLIGVLAVVATCRAMAADPLVAVPIPREPTGSVSSNDPFYYQLVFEHTTFGLTKDNRNLVDGLIKAVGDIAISTQSERSVNVNYTQEDGDVVLSETNYLVASYSATRHALIGRLLGTATASTATADIGFGLPITPWRQFPSAFGPSDTLVISVGAADQLALSRIEDFKSRLNANTELLSGLVKRASAIDLIASTASHVFSGAYDTKLRVALGPGVLTEKYIRGNRYLAVVPRGKVSELRAAIEPTDDDGLPTLFTSQSTRDLRRREDIPYVLFSIRTQPTLIRAGNRAEEDAMDYLRKHHQDWLGAERKLVSNFDRATACAQLSADLTEKGMLLELDRHVVLAAALKYLGYDPDRSGHHASRTLVMADGTNGTCLSVPALRRAREIGVQIGSCATTNCRRVQEMLVAWHENDVAGYAAIRTSVDLEGKPIKSGQNGLAGLLTEYKLHRWFGGYGAVTEEGCPTGAHPAGTVWQTSGAAIEDVRNRCRF